MSLTQFLLLWCHHTSFIHSRWNIFQLGNNVIGLFCMLSQVFCFISIGFVQVKYYIRERRNSSGDVRKRMNSMYDTHIEELNVGKWFSFEAEEPVKTTFLSSIFNSKNVTKFNSSRLQENFDCNKIFYESCYSISLILAIVLFATSAITRKTMALHDLNDYPPVILRILDLGPPMCMSIGLPLSIHAKHPEILKYFKRIFIL